MDAAIRCFSRHGYRRTSMDEVARESGISRAALYLYFETKEALFLAICQYIHEKLVASAAVAAARPGTLEQRLVGIFECMITEYFELLAATEHGAELLDENCRLCGDLYSACKNQFHGVLLQILVEAQDSGEIALKENGLSAARAADMIHSAVVGIESYAGTDFSPDRFRQELAQMLKILVAGISRH